MKAYELYQTVAPPLLNDMLRYFREEEREVYKTSLASLASNRKLRPVFIQKKPVADQMAWMLKTLRLKSTDVIGEHLLQVWFMKGHQPMLIAFCDAMGIQHNGEGSVEGDLPEELDAGKLTEAVEALLKDHDPGLVGLYLHIFNLQVPGGWESLTSLLQTDTRLRIGPEPEEAPAEPAETPAAPEEAPAAPAETPAAPEEAPAEPAEKPTEPEEAPAVTEEERGATGEE